MATQKPYHSKQWLYDHYVKKRMNLTDIAALLREKYNIAVSPQTLYNYVEKYDLLRYRGKGRKLKVNAPAMRNNKTVDALRNRADQRKKMKNRKQMKRK